MLVVKYSTDFVRIQRERRHTAAVILDLNNRAKKNECSIKHSCKQSNVILLFVLIILLFVTGNA